MDKRSRQAKPQQTTTHPEAPKHTGRGVPDENSSKAISSERDGRSGHDKDGNQAQRESPRRRSP
jgi:hypothetical protein